jgi:hypothetical protein
MNAAALNAFNGARLRTQDALFGRPIKLDGVEGRGAHSGIKYQAKLREQGGGEELLFDGILRIAMADWEAYTVPQHFDKVKVELMVGPDWKAFKVLRATCVHLGGEWKLELEAL